jgi:ABC-type glycerol-3-phosphate transport system substrate-binding protein
VKANGALPSRKSAYAHTPRFDEPPFDLFRRLQEESARARPRTPKYPNLTRSFAAALRDIAHGAEVQEALDQAAASTQRILDRQWGEGP